MNTENNKEKQEVPDALGNDKLQGEDMAKTGHGQQVHPKEKKEQEPHDAKQESQSPRSNEDETIGIP